MDKQLKVFIVDEDITSSSVIANYLSDVGFVSSVKIVGNLDEFLTLKSDENSNLVIIDISTDSEEALERIKKLSSENKNCIFIASSYNISANSVIAAMRSGVKEFLNKPILKNDLITAVKKAADIAEDGENTNKGKIISIFSNKGGLGKTTVAVNLANDLADIYKEKVALVDLNMHLGDVTAFLDIHPAYDIRYVIDSLQNTSDEALVNMLERYKSSNLYVLADSPYREPVGTLTPKNISDLLEALKKIFSFVIIDNSSNIDYQTKTAFDASDMVLFVTTSNLPTIRNCTRSLEILDNLNYTPVKIKIVLNRFINSESYTVEDIEAAIGRKVFWKIPNNYFTVIEAVNKGITLQELNPDTNVAENYRQLAQNIQQALMVYST